MDFLGVGLPEIFLILLIALIVLGPQDMVKAGRTLGRMMRKIVMSPTWGTLQEMTREIRHLPTRLMREAGIEEQDLKDLKEFRGGLPRTQELRRAAGVDQVKQDLNQWQRDLSAWTTPPSEPASPAPPASPIPEAEISEENNHNRDIEQ